jgi:short-subunit dehydrogenase
MAPRLLRGQLLNRYGPWALVAGASEGLGEAFAEVLADWGFNLVLVARREQVLESVARRLTEAYGVTARCIPADLGKAETAADVAARCAGIDLGLVIYNAAYAPMGEFAALPAGLLQQAIDVNVRGPVNLIHALLPGLQARPRAGVVLMSSLAGEHGSPKIATYAATKAFTTALAGGLWSELGRDGIDVTACIAGAVRTPGLIAAVESGTQREAPGTLDAARVAGRALLALGRRPVTVPGLTNKLARFLMGRVLPTQAAIRIMASSTSGLGAQPAAENTSKERSGG